MEYGEAATGGPDTKEVYAIYDGQYYFDDSFHAFALGRLTVDGLAGDDVADQDGRLKRDAFLGCGPSFRVLASDQTTWRLQAGLGLRHTKSFRWIRPEPPGSSRMPKRATSCPRASFIA